MSPVSSLGFAIIAVLLCRGTTARVVRRDTSLEDGRVCPKKWVYFANQCYLFADWKATVKEAMTSCANAASNGRLVEVNNAQEEAWLEQELKLRDMSYVWMGISDIMKESVFLKLSDAGNITFANWNRNEPNDEFGVEDCAEWVSNGKWNDAPCDDRKRFVCEI